MILTLPEFKGHSHWTSDMVMGALIGTMIGHEITKQSNPSQSITAPSPGSHCFTHIIRWPCRRKSTISLIMTIKSLIIFLITTLSVHATNKLNTNPLQSIEKFKSMITVEFKGYNISDTESIQLYGAKHRKFFNDSWYWGESGYGALFGIRSGYLEGGIILGSLHRGHLIQSLTHAYLLAQEVADRHLKVAALLSTQPLASEHNYHTRGPH